MLRLHVCIHNQWLSQLRMLIAVEPDTRLLYYRAALNDHVPKLHGGYIVAIMIILSKGAQLSLAPILRLIIIIGSVRKFGWATERAQSVSLVEKEVVPCQWKNETISLHQSGLLSVQFNFSNCPTLNASAGSTHQYNVS